MHVLFHNLLDNVIDRMSIRIPNTAMTFNPRFPEAILIRRLHSDDGRNGWFASKLYTIKITN